MTTLRLPRYRDLGSIKEFNKIIGLYTLHLKHLTLLVTKFSLLRIK